MARKSTTVLLILGGAALLWATLKQRAAAAATAAVGAPVLGPVTPSVSYVGSSSSSSPAVPLDTTGASALVAPVTSQSIAAGAGFWSQLQQAAGPGAGWVTFPSGSQAPAAELPWAIDSAGTYFTQWGGLVYQVGAVSADGTYPAVAVG